jgi:hypothetical protein
VSSHSEKSRHPRSLVEEMQDLVEETQRAKHRLDDEAQRLYEAAKEIFHGRPVKTMIGDGPCQPGTELPVQISDMGGSQSKDDCKRRRGRPPDRLREIRREAIRIAAGTGVKGKAYCAALDAKQFPTPVSWQKNEACPQTYLEAWLIPKWRKRIQDEKSKATKGTRHPNR